MFKKISIGLVTFICVVSYSLAQALASNLRETPVVQVVRDWSPSVVNISTERVLYLKQQPFWNGYGPMFDDKFSDFVNRNTQTIQKEVRLKGIGSGVIIHDDGVIVTNAHVVNMASKVYVVFSDGVTCDGEVILINQVDDLAFVKVKPPHQLKSVHLANPDDIRIGETVISIGNPFGLENSVSAGIISGKARNFALPKTQHLFTDLVQTDVSINLGSSGGALLNLDGELVGVNLAVIEQAQNIAFAVSVRKIKDGLDYYKSLKEQGRFQN